jgi:hypothetical protein
MQPFRVIYDPFSWHRPTPRALLVKLEQELAEARREAERAHFDRQAALEGLLDQEKLHAQQMGEVHLRTRQDHQVELERLDATHQAALEEMRGRRRSEREEERAAFKAELERLRSSAGELVGAWKDQVTRLAGELAAMRELLTSSQRALIELKREGFEGPIPAGTLTPDQGLAPEIQAAIDQVAFSPTIRQHLEAYAWRQLDRKVAAPEIAAAIIAGESSSPDAAPASRTSSAGGEIPDDAPIRRMGADDLEGDEEDDEE